MCVVGGLIVAGMMAYYSATVDHAGVPAVEQHEAEKPGQTGMEQYGQVEYVPVAQQNAQTLTYLFVGIGVVAAFVIVAAVVSVRRSREDG